MKKYYAELTDSKVIYDKEHDIFLAPDLKGNGDIIEFETKKPLYQALFDLAIKHPTKNIIGVKEEYLPSTQQPSGYVSDPRIHALIGFGHKDRTQLISTNNLWWQIPTATFVTLFTKTDENEVTYNMWVLKKEDIQDRIDSKCKTMRCTYKDHVEESPD